MKRTALGLITVLFFSSYGWAEDVSATWTFNDGNSMELIYRDDKHIRMDTSEEGYMLFTENKAYMVMRENGQWQAMDMDQMADMMKALGPAAAQTMQDDFDTEQNQLKDTGRTEVVAGYKGKVYMIEEEQTDGSLKEVEIVFSTHPDIKKINQGWLALSTRLGKMLGQDMAQSIERATSESERGKLGGLLRYDNTIKLKNVQNGALDDAVFKLPEGTTVVQMPQFSQQGANDVSGSASQQPLPPNAPNEPSQPTDTADQNASDDLKEEINKGVRGLLKKLF